MDATFTLYLIRHAPAEPRGEAWPDDAERPLSVEGARKMRRVADGLRALDVRLDALLSSPYARAHETAMIVSARTAGHPPVLDVDWLTPGASPAAVARALGRLPTRQTVALVGHEPDLGQLAAWFIEADRPVPFKKGAVAAFEVDSWPPRAPARLAWFAPPSMLRALAAPAGHRS